MSQTISPQINPRFRAPPNVTANYADPGCVVVTYSALSFSQPFTINVGTVGTPNVGLTRTHAVKVDNLYGSKEFVITAGDSRDRISVPAGTVGIFPIYSASCVFNVIDNPLLSSPPSSNAGIRTLVFYDTPQTYYSSDGQPTGSKILSGSIPLAGFVPGTYFFNLIPAQLLSSPQLQKISSIQLWFDAVTQVGGVEFAYQITSFWQLPPAGPVLGTLFTRAIYATNSLATVQSLNLYSNNFDPDYLFKTDYQLQLRVIVAATVVSALINYSIVLTSSELEP